MKKVKKRSIRSINAEIKALKLELSKPPGKIHVVSSDGTTIRRRKSIEKKLDKIYRKIAKKIKGKQLCIRGLIEL
jgi:hypothetical protein